MFGREIECYIVEIYEKTVLNEYCFAKEEKFDQIEDAISYGRSELQKNHRVIIKEVAKLVGWAS